MTEPVRVAAGERSVEELLGTLEAGRRVVVTTEFLGGEHEVTLRHDGEVFYCDTPTRLHRHESREGMERCLRNQGYAEGGVDDGRV
jgi:hemin uptake protein HemP